MMTPRIRIAAALAALAASLWALARFSGKPVSPPPQPPPAAPLFAPPPPPPPAPPKTSATPAKTAKARPTPLRDKGEALFGTPH